MPVPNPPDRTRQADPVPAGALTLDARGRLLADIGNPFYAVAGFLLLTTLPYFVPLEYMAIIKVYGPGQHVFIAAIMTGVLLGAYALYAALSQPRLHTPPQGTDDEFAPMLHRAMAGMIWLGLVANVALLVWCLRELPGGVFAMKRALADFEGVNILSQSYLFALGPFVYLSLVLRRPWKLLLAVLGCVLLARGLLLAERLALLEFAIPLLVVLSLLRVVAIRLSHLVMIGLGVPALFVIGEIFRSFYRKFVEESGWSGLDLGFILQWNLERLALYYIDTLNKFYFQLKYQFFYISSFYSEGVGKIASRFGLTERPDKEPLGPLVSSFDYGNEEMTNPGGLGILVSDFGWYGLIVFAVFLGLLFAAHWRALRGGLIALSFYPILFLTLAEMPRFVYLYLSRALFPLLLFLGVYLLVRLIAGQRPMTAPALERSA